MPETDDVPTPTLLDWNTGAEIAPLAPGEVRAWIVELDAGLPPGADVDSTGPGPEMEILSDDERTRALRFVRVRERRRFARCRAALRRILGGMLNQPPESLKFRAAAVGKPELDQGPGVVAPIRFNVSHSADLGLIAVCLGREVGADIEKVRHISEAVRIVGSFFTPAEQAAFAAIPEIDRDVIFHRGWTRKEAVLKGIGSGIGGLSSRQETGFGTTPLAPQFTPATPDPKVDRWLLWEAAPRPGFLAALAVDAGDPPFRVAGA